MTSKGHIESLRKAVWSGRGRVANLSEQYEASERISRFESAIKSRLDQPLTLSDAAYILGFELTYCSKVFREVTGLPYLQWMRRVRIEAAKDLLRETKLPITSVAIATGFRDFRTFQRNFRAHEGKCAKQFRLENNAGNGR